MLCESLVDESAPIAASLYLLSKSPGTKRDAELFRVRTASGPKEV